MFPVAHPELNPIEHVWGIVKRTVASHNFTHSLKEVERLTKIQIRSFTGPHGSGPNRTFGKFVRNTIEEEDRYRRLAADIGIEEDGNIGNKENRHEEDDNEESNGGSDVGNVWYIPLERVCPRGSRARSSSRKKGERQ
jgi:hypothetical protein